MSALSLVYEDIKVQLLDRIGGMWPEGTRLPPTPQLARELEAGQRNTLRAVQELVREGYLQSRPGRGTYVAPQLPPRRSAERNVLTPTDRRMRVLIVMAPGTDPFITEIAEAFSASMSDRQCDIDYHWTHGHFSLRDERFRRFDAFAVINPDNRRITFGPHQKLVCISTINSVNVDATADYDVVSVEEEHGGFMAGRLLRDTGCEHVGFLGVRHRSTPDTTDRTSSVRRRGFEAGFGKPVAANDCLWATSYTIDGSILTASCFAAMDRRPQAVFAASDDLAAGFALGGKMLGMTPGRDYQLIGFDGQYVTRELTGCPPITSIAVPATEMGRRAAHLLLQRVEDPSRPIERVLLGCSLFRGATVKNLPEEIIP